MSLSKEKFSRLAELRRKSREFEEEIALLSTELVGEMRIEEVDKIETDDGSFTLVARKNWTYSEATKAMAEGLKEMQTGEKADGTATAEETFSLTFREAKK